VPAEQALAGEWGLAIACGIQHHVDNTFDMTVHWGQGADIYPEATGDRGAHRFDIQLLAFDLAGFDHIVSQRRQTGLVPQGQPNIGQATDQLPLRTADFCQWCDEGC